MTGRFKKALLERNKDAMKGLKMGIHKSRKGSLTQAGRDKINARTKGNLQAPVTKEPSKLKKGSKAANRRKSFCARMGGMKKSRTSAKTANDPDSRINKALRKWNCSTDVNTKGDPAMNERNKQNRDAVRQMTSGQTPAEVKAQRSLKTANPDWITPDDKKSPRQQAHDSRRGVKQAREALAEACWKGYKAKGMKKKGSKMVPNCVKEAVLGEAVKRRSQTAVNELPPKDLKKLEKGLGRAKPGRVAKATGKPAPVVKKPKEKPPELPILRSEVLNRSGGKHTPDGMPVQTSSDHKDYLRKKHYANKKTRGKGYGKSGTSTKPDSIEITNQRGLTNKSPAKQERARKKFEKLANAPSPTQSGRDYAKGEYDPSMSKDTTWGDDED
jgi:hypothetical protein